MSRVVACAALLLAMSIASAASAADGGAPSAAGPSDAGAPGDAGAVVESVNGCVETIPSGGQRPEILDTFPERGFSGYAATLAISVDHGKGETVLPNGLVLQSASDAAKVLKDASFVIPDQDGGAAARIVSANIETGQGGRTRTKLELLVVPLPAEPGRHVLSLPPLPVAVARANGEIATVCTRPHRIVVDDPIASTNDPKPKPNPPPRAQREEWTSLKRALGWAAIGLVLGGAIAYLFFLWNRRPKPVPPPPPPRPAWEVALERLDEVRHAGLLEVGRFGEYFDRTSDAVRSYVGALFGFDGLESTTDEIVARLRSARLHGVALPEVVAFLQECDLVKFANVTPSLEDCRRVLDDGERIVRATMPRAPSFQRAPGSGPLSEPPRAGGAS